MSNATALDLLNRVRLPDGDPQKITAVAPVIDAFNENKLFRRYSLGVKARIALKLSLYDVVEDVLKRLLDMTFVPGNRDCGIERDFFDRLPAEAIDGELARRYDQYSRAGE